MEYEFFRLSRHIDAVTLGFVPRCSHLSCLAPKSFRFHYLLFRVALNQQTWAATSRKMLLNAKFIQTSWIQLEFRIEISRLRIFEFEMLCSGATCICLFWFLVVQR